MEQREKRAEDKTRCDTWGRLYGAVPESHTNQQFRIKSRTHNIYRTTTGWRRRWTLQAAKSKKKSIKLLSNATLVRRGRQIDVCEITESRQCRVASNAKAHFMSILIFHSKAAWTTGLQHYEFTSRTLVPDSPGSSRVVLMHFRNGTGPTVSSVFKCLLLFLLLPLRLTRWLCVWVRNAKWFRKRGKI